jgi:hypothetical protein
LKGPRTATHRNPGIDQSNFFLGKTEKAARKDILIWCADRLQTVKLRNFKLDFQHVCAVAVAGSAGKRRIGLHWQVRLGKRGICEDCFPVLSAAVSKPVSACA